MGATSLIFLCVLHCACGCNNKLNICCNFIYCLFKIYWATKVFFFPMPPHALSDFVVSPELWLKCNRLLRLGRPVGAVTLSWWEWWWDERWIWGARGALNLISTNYPDHGHHGRLPLSKKNAHGRAGNGTRDFMVVVRSCDHQATRLVRIYLYYFYLRYCIGFK